MNYTQLGAMVTVVDVIYRAVSLFGLAAAAEMSFYIPSTSNATPYVLE